MEVGSFVLDNLMIASPALLPCLSPPPPFPFTQPRPLWVDSCCVRGSAGAYIFRPNSTTAYPVNSGVVPVTVQSDSTVTVVTQVWAPWLSTEWRLYKGQAYVEVEYAVGPVPIDGRPLGLSSCAAHRVVAAAALLSVLRLLPAHFAPHAWLCLRQPGQGDLHSLHQRHCQRQSQVCVVFGVQTDGPLL
jgi:hypothetical protein